MNRRQSADSSSDGIPDWWCLRYLLDPNDPNLASGNPDNDAQTTYEEWLADTNPTNALSCFRITAISNGPPVTVEFGSSSNRVYTLLSCTNLAAPFWTPVPGQTSIQGNGALQELSDTNAAPPRFYRVQVQVP